jgi:hypothetical protein
MPDTIQTNIRDIINEKYKDLNDRIEAKCTLWNLALSGLRSEWLLEHRNLIQRYEASEQAKALAKTEVDRHFETINSLQARMDKLSDSFVTKDEFKKQVDSLKTWMTGCMVSLIVLLVTVIIDIMRKGT